MISVSSAYKTYSRRQGRVVKPRVYFAWDKTTFTDESDRFLRAVGSHRLFGVFGGMLNKGAPDTMTITMRNDQYRYSLDATTGDDTVRSIVNVAEGYRDIPVMLEIGFPSGSGGSYEYCPIFYGVVRSATDNESTAIFRISDLSYRFMQQKATSTLLRDMSISEIIEYYAMAFLGMSSAGTAVGYAVIGGGHLPGAVIGEGATTITVGESLWSVPYAWLDDESVMDEIYDLAMVDGGALIFDVYGNLRYMSISDMIGTTTPVATLDEDEYREITVNTDDTTLVDKLSVAWQAFREGPLTVLYQQQRSEARTVRSGETISFDAVTTYPASAIFDPVPDTDYWFVAPGGQVLNDYVQISLTNHAQRSIVTVTNTHPLLSGTFYKFQLRGIPLLSEQQSEVFAEIGSGSRKRTISSPYIQYHSHAEYILELYKRQASLTNKAVQINGLHGLPWLEVGDIISYSSQGGIYKDAIITAIEMVVDKGYETNITVTNLDDIIDTSRDYFIVGTGTTGVDAAWY